MKWVSLGLAELEGRVVVCCGGGSKQRLILVQESFRVVNFSVSIVCSVV